MTHVIIVLGNKNDKYGNLSPISKSRCELAYDLFSKRPQSKLICTGGFGKNFNQSPHSHASLNRGYLTNLGISEQVILDNALSRFTIEDATLTAPLLSANNAQSVDIVSSDFHMQRVKLIFEYLQPSLTKQFHCSKAFLPESERIRLEAHETHAIQRDFQSLQAHYTPLV
ncbi:YdcF family protein [Pseudoalteromonas luteoviolacea]|uniref:DUF218 domain-containing protein n=1 Tax=Pseudoalteromonas luteoviolacea NCIMB 1942 TaxID=1365253 RepID=A0A166ZW73_9GAMM|nr:YdcF family protein [Pseudoalteromonas luteoviolacea]KZN44732.1 hypothetical protein N482_16200 [Pseudoalteromonas luteoviolacea NCIMB 1942]KZW98633.1 hypothetical protein JL49_22110 [Pseudoalteromonas luteoviolacea]